MPDKANPTAKRRKTKKTVFPRDGCDSSFASAYRDSSEELQFKQIHEHRNSNGKGKQELKLPAAIKDPQRHQAEGLSLKSPSEKSLKEHMESILTEVKEAREKLFEWWRQEIQTIVATASQRRVSDTDAGKRKEQVDCGASRDHASVQAMPTGGQACQKNTQDSGKLDLGKPRNAVDACRKSCALSPDPKPTVVDVAMESGSGVTSKPVNVPEQGTASDKPGLKVDIPAHNVISKLPGESKNALFDMCFGAELGGDVKDVEGLDGTIESGVTMREGFEFNKGNHDIQKGLERLDRLRETKNALLDMGFDDDESNEGNGVGCSLESAASSKVNTGFSKASVGMQGSFTNAGYGGGFGKDHLGSNGGPEGVGSSADVYGSTKVKKEVTSEEGKHAVVKEGLVNSMRGGRLDDESRQVDGMMGVKSGQASLKRSHVGGGSLTHVNQPRDARQQVGMGGGVKRSYATAMTFKGSALECKNDVFQQANNSFSDIFTSATSSILVVKDSSQPPLEDKGKVESLALPGENDALGMTGAASSPWSMFTKNAVQHTLQDSKVAHIEYASRSKLGDAMVGSGRTSDFPGFDQVLGYTSHYKACTEMMDAYQQERANTSSMYFSSLCTDNSAYLPTSNRVMNMHRSPPNASPSSGTGLRPMLMGMPGHVGGNHDPSNKHTFLGLGMNGVPAVANGMQVFPGLYLQNNQQHNQAPFKNTSQSTSPMVSHQESSAVQEKAILELNF